MTHVLWQHDVSRAWMFIDEDEYGLEMALFVRIYFVMKTPEDLAIEVRYERTD